MVAVMDRVAVLTLSVYIAVISIATQASHAMKLRCSIQGMKPIKISVSEKDCSHVNSTQDGVPLERNGRKTTWRVDSAGTGYWIFLESPSLTCYWLGPVEGSKVNKRIKCRGHVVSKVIAERSSGVTSPHTGCYNWRPSISLTPHKLHNNSITVKWTPALKNYGLEVSLIDKNEDTIVWKRFKSYETGTDVTQFRFDDVADGRYEVKLQPQGCEDCPDREFKECIAKYTTSDPVNIPADVANDNQDGGIPLYKGRAQGDHDTEMVYILAGLLSLAATTGVMLAVLWYRRDKFRKAKWRVEKQDVSCVDLEGHDARRIVLLYSADDQHHIAAVMSFAALLRALLGVEVLVEREQGLTGTSGIVLWLTQVIKPPTIVLVIASKALYQDVCRGNSSCMVALASNMQSRQQNFINRLVHGKTYMGKQTVILIDFGYGGESKSRLALEYYHLFSDIAEVTVKSSDGRHCENLGPLLNCVSGSVSDVARASVKLDDFLEKVNNVDEHLREGNCIGDCGGSFCDGSRVSWPSQFPNNVDIGDDVFTVHSDVTDSSCVTISVMCKNCKASSCLTLPHQPIEVNGRTDLSLMSTDQHHSCVTLHISDTNDTSDTESVIRPLLDDASIVDTDDDSTLESVDLSGRDC